VVVVAVAVGVGFGVAVAVAVAVAVGVAVGSGIAVADAGARIVSSLTISITTHHFSMLRRVMAFPSGKASVSRPPACRAAFPG
jgi:hypothetical protein